ncbi:MAG: hypothetical protein V5B38_23575 [Candidatus Accumulibacter propinquus]
MKFEIEARKRTLQGSGASRRLRRQNRVPAIVYGGTRDPLMIDIDHNEILLNLRKEAFHSSVLTLTLDGNRQQASCCATRRCTPGSRWSCTATSSGSRRTPSIQRVSRCTSSTATSPPASSLKWRHVAARTTTSKSAACRRTCRHSSKST